MRQNHRTLHIPADFITPKQLAAAQLFKTKQAITSGEFFVFIGSVFQKCMWFLLVASFFAVVIVAGVKEIERLEKRIVVLELKNK